jgi:hypothetical protein
MWGCVVPYGSDCAGKYIMRRLSVTSTRKVSVSHYPARWRQEFCQILANLLSCQVMFNACDNRYGDTSPCFIAGSLVVKSNVSDMCACCACQTRFQCRRGAFYFLKPRFSFFIFVLNLSWQGFIIHVEFCLSFCRCPYYLGDLSHRAI